MSFSLSAAIGLAGSGALNLNATASSRIDQLQIGPAAQAAFPAGAINWTTGSPGSLSNGALQSKNWFLGEITIAGGSTVNFAFNGGSYNDPSGAALAMTAVTLVALSIVAIAGQTTVPDGTDYLEVGPQGVSDAAQLWFGGTGATCYETVYWQSFHPGPAAGWTVNSSTAQLLPIKNPGSNSITCALLVIGAP